ncbi:hypothetical protein G6F32_014956 [Rhizopus arrhizus]|nr:hypothetical protein G6F32_014956 [Rhizopus arrhizus]
MRWPTCSPRQCGGTSSIGTPLGADPQRLGGRAQVLHQLRGAGGIGTCFMVECSGNAGTTGEAAGDVGGVLGGGDRDQVGLLDLRQAGGDVQDPVPGVAGFEQHGNVA